MSRSNSHLAPGRQGPILRDMSVGIEPNSLQHEQTSAGEAFPPPGAGPAPPKPPKSVRIFTARFISIVGHPFVLLPLLLFLPRFENNRGDALHSTVMFMAIVLVPLSLLIWRARASGQWQTVDASDKTDRPALYGTAIAALAGASAYFHFVQRSADLVRGFAAAALMMLVAAGLNRWIKISLHVAFACFCGVLLARTRLSYGLPVLLLVPALIWSRLVLSRHVLSETIAGVILGLMGAGCILRF